MTLDQFGMPVASAPSGGVDPSAISEAINTHDDDSGAHSELFSALAERVSDAETALAGSVAGLAIEPLAASSGTVTVPATEGKVYTHTLAAGETIVIAAASSGYMPTVELHLEMPSTAVSFTFGTTIWWIDADGNFSSGNAAPDFSTGGKVYALVFRFDGTRWLGNLAYTAGEPQIPTRGLVFYAPLSSEQIAAETGQSLTVENYSPSYSGPSFTTIQGVPCAYIGGGTGYSASGADILSTASSPMTMSIWFYVPEAVSEPYGARSFFTFGYDYRATNINFAASTQNTYVVLGNWGGSSSIQKTLSQSLLIGKWINLVGVRDSSVTTLYVNGVSAGTTSNWTLDPSDSAIWIGRIVGYNYDYGFKGYLAAARIYNRALTGQEIEALSREFHPTEA